MPFTIAKIKNLSRGDTIETKNSRPAGVFYSFNKTAVSAILRRLLHRRTISHLRHGLAYRRGTTSAPVGRRQRA